MMLRCTFCNQVSQGTQFQATRHFTQTNYCKDVSDKEFYEIVRRTHQKFEADHTKRVARYAAEREVDVPGTGGARGGEAGRRPVEGGVGGDGGHDVPEHPLGGGGSDTEEGVIHVDREARGPGEEEVSEHEDMPEFYPGTGERMEDWRRRAGKGAATEGSFKRKEGGTDPAATPTGKRLREQKVTDVYSCQTGFELEGADYILACRQFEDFHIQQGRFMDWGGAEVRARGRACSSDGEMIECASWWSQFVAGAPELQRRACIFRPYPREDDSNEEPVPEAADDPALRIPREIDETHDNPDSEEPKAHTARRAPDRADREMLGGEEEFWGPFGEVASIGGTEARVTTPTPTRRESSMPPPPAPSPAPPSPVSPLQPVMATADTEELGSSLPQRGLLHRGEAVRQRRLRSPSPGILQEEGALSAAAVEAGMAPAAVADAMMAAAVDEIAAAAAEAAVLEEMTATLLEEEAPAAGGAAGGATTVEVEGAVAVEEEEAPSADAVERWVAGPVEEEIAAQAEVQHGGDDERLMQQFLTKELNPVIAGMTPGVVRGFGISDSEMGTHLAFDLSMGLPPSCGGATSTDRAPSRDEAAGQTLTQIPRERTTTESPDAARDIMERERARLLASSNPRAQVFARALEEARLRETGGDCVQGVVVAGEDVAEGVATWAVDEALPGGAEAVDITVEGRPHAVDEAVQAGQPRRDEGAIDARRVVKETATGPVVPFSGLHLAQGRQSQAVQMAVHGVPPPVIMDLGSEPVVVPPCLPSHFAPQEVRRPLDAEELAREAVRDVTRLDQRIFDQRLEHPAWQAIPSVPYGPASPVWSGSTSTGGHVVGHVPRV
ncbi:hypothetical protein CBR_g35017 [Chara braunii]|uniref:Uncharacterized protein n=1 Tax=Chara braunii TaxID=69332 RepID=A0A388LK61_CHABU|nr:hypothetical protein CBR_g35017 [Chara braunii]|eukprot:GBG82651.1 hypothetical protein CBR_g35017 [Chara braunii]